MAHSNGDQTSILEGSEGTAAKRANGAIEPLKFHARRDIRIIEVALTQYKDSLESLAKKNSADGYADLARQILDDAAGIDVRLLPQLRAQREMPLVSFDALEKQASDHVSGWIRVGFAGLDELKAPPTKSAIKQRKDALQRQLATAIATYVRDVAQAAYTAGFAARTMTPEGLAAEHIARLSGGRAD